ncbi:D-alanyl-D-alanine carboxypeptidase family protein [Qiania dongpingensis]|nr:D-alanyl-D-alanine carboxypeptidase family protein [Qiania dongpingensis]
MKRLYRMTAALCLSLCMMVSLCMPVFASDEGQPSVIPEIMESVEAGGSSGAAEKPVSGQPEEGQSQQEDVPGEAVETSGKALPASAETSGTEETGESAAQPESSVQGAEESQGENTSSQGSGVQADLGITAQAAILIEASTGTVIYEKNPDEALRPASITKIMTLILIFDAIRDGRISLDDQVATSAYAKSMGGSQVFLEEGEVQTVETLIKCIVIASGNDAAVTMAEYIAGSESEFVRQMNERAKSLGMESTNFEDCCGLTDSGTHLTSARDVALMSRELITKYPEIENYSTIWMENITHVTNKGTSEFCLSNTNKLLKMSNSFTVTGLKTGSTSLAKYCLSATAKKDGVELIAVIMAAPDFKVRFSEAASLLNYGFAGCKLYTDSDENREELPKLPVAMGVVPEVSLRYGGEFSYLSTNGEDFSAIERQISIPEKLEAPVQEGDIVGSLTYMLGGKTLGTVDILAAESVEAAGFGDYLGWMWQSLLM